MKNSEISGVDFVRATIAFMREKGKTYVSFDKREYDLNLTKNELPWCVTFDEFIDTISISNEPSKRDKICICIETEGGEIRYDYFDGTENENFDHIFHDVYDEIWDGGICDDEGDIWLWNYLSEKKSIKNRLISLINQCPVPKEGIKINRPWYNDDNGFNYDTLQRLDTLGNRLFLVDSANGMNNPTACELKNLSASHLYSVLRDAVLCNQKNLLKDYDKFTGTSDISDWAEDAAAIMSLSKEILKTDTVATAKKGIYDSAIALTDFTPTVTIVFDETKKPLPFLVTVDDCAGNTVEDCKNIVRAIIRRLENKDECLVELYTQEEMTARMSIHDGTAVCNWDDSNGSPCMLPEESWLSFEEWLNDEILKQNN